jgi:hypothetical protein
VFASAYVLETPGIWRQYKEGSCEGQSAAINEDTATGKPVLTVTFVFFTDDVDDGTTATAQIPLSE